MTIEKCHHCVGSQACENQVVNECLPVSAFGDVSGKSVKVAVIGLNPALNEFLHGGVAKIRSQRLAMLTDYHLTSRADLRDADVADVKSRRERYFREDREWHSYFEKIESMISRIQPSWSFATGQAVHIDLVACATKVRWGDLSQECQKELIANCRKHLVATLNQLPNGTILLFDGMRVVNEMRLLESTQPGFKFVQEIEARISLIQGNRGYAGKLKLGEKEFPFRGWSMPVGKLALLWRYDLAHWICETFDPPYPFFPTS